MEAPRPWLYTCQARLYGKHRFSWDHSDVIDFYSKSDFSADLGGGVTLPMDPSLIPVVPESVVYDYKERLLGRKRTAGRGHVSVCTVPQLEQLAQDTAGLSLSHATHSG